VAVSLLLLAAALILAAGAGAVLLRRWPVLADRLYVTLVLAGAAAGLARAVMVLAGGPVPMVTLPGSLPGGVWAFGLDALSAWFLLPVLGVGACAGVFGIGYLGSERGHRPVGGTHALFALLLVGLTGVVTAQSVVPFLCAWEIMAISAYLLVMHEHEQAEVRRAGLIYIVLTHLSTLALIGMFAALRAHATGSTFSELGLGSRSPGTVQTVALVLALLGFNLKAGAVPLHFWLPGAHAAAPSHVSAVLSGVMLKMGIYGLLRVLLLLGGAPAWFGWTLFGLGLLSGVMGVVWALAQHDLKRLLAYHSVENIGIILLGMGVGVLGVAYREPGVALLGFAGALLHTLNHALFKGLLFLGAGAVLRATGTRIIDQLGGLARELPWTAAAFTVGSMAIVGLPPFNGFVSEWTVFQGLLAAGASSESLRYAVIGAAGLGLIGALALACFTKVDGTLFLGHLRSATPHPRPFRDPGPAMLGPMLTLAGLCLAIGLLPVAVVRPARLIAAGLLGGLDGGGTGGAAWVADAVKISVLGLGLLALIALLIAGRRWLPVRGRLRLAPTWGCAIPASTPRMQYTASSYAALLLAAYGPLSGVQDSRAAGTFHSSAADPAQDWVALPAWRRLGRASVRLRALQGGRLRWYLLSVIFTLLALLFYLTTAGHPR
jgi:hydrogenase-4 component B